MSTVSLEARELSIGYHTRPPRLPLVSGINLRLENGKLTCLIGPNGAGKTTLLRTLAGLMKPFSGNVLLEGAPLASLDIEELAKGIGVVLTDGAHPGDLRVYQVVELGRLPYTDWSCSLSHQDHEMVEQALHQVNAGHLAERSFGELSDGERQMVMVARALAQDTQVLILDEPTVFLDWSNRGDLLVTLKRIAYATGKAVLISSHDLELVLQIADDVWVMGLGMPLASGGRNEVISSGVLEEVFSGPYRKFIPTRNGVLTE